jgi:hypothetical protein
VVPVIVGRAVTATCGGPARSVVETLHTDDGTWLPADVIRTHQSFRNGPPIPGARQAVGR